MNKIIGSFALGIVTLAFLAAFPIITSAQTRWAAPPKNPEIPAPSPAVHLPFPPMMGGDTSERSIKVDSGVNVSLCVTQGTVRVNGWNRNELRVFVQDGSKFGFKVQMKDDKTGSPVLVMVTGVETKNKNSVPTDCIWGGEIEIDLPVNSTVTIKGQEITANIDLVKKANVTTAGGNISFRNIAKGITASTYEGCVTVEESKGAMILETTTGNILVFQAGPDEIGDMFKAKTNSGAVSLQRLEYRQIDVNSISGSVGFNGAILSGGSYSLSTSKGSIRMSVPPSSVGRITATYGFGSFNSELPVTILTENVSGGPVKTIVANLGKGDGNTTLKLATNNGSISIKKQ